jgi:glycosyltransferase involved in cell wall biosynthesis
MASARQAAFVVPGRIETRTGGSIYDRRMADGLRRRGWSVEIVELDAGFPFPASGALEHAAAAFASIREGTVALVDGLVIGAMPGIIEGVAKRLPIAVLIHLPIGANLGIPAKSARALADGERRALMTASLVVVTGTAALPMLAGYGIPNGRVVVVEPGADRAPLSRGSQSGAIELLSVATLNPGKGHAILLQALAGLTGFAWHLTCGGSVTHHPATVDQVRATIRTLGLEDRVSLAGELDEIGLGAAYDTSDVFVLASLRETYGMAIAEALAHGLPVIGTATGAIPALVGEHAGIVVPPGDTDALAGALQQVIADPACRARLAAGARQARERLQSWDEAAAKLSTALAGVAIDG